MLEAVITEVERDGIDEWAPSNNHPDQVNGRDEAEQDGYEQIAKVTEPQLDIIIEELMLGVKPQYGGVEEARLRQSAVTNFEKLVASLEDTRPAHAKMGHNHPPSDERGGVNEIIEEIRKASQEVLDELRSKAPDALKVAETTYWLKNFADWVLKKGDTAVDSFAKSFGSSMGKVATPLMAFTIGKSYPEISSYVMSSIHHVIQWLSHVVL